MVAIALAADLIATIWFAVEAGDGSLGTSLFWVLAGATALAAVLVTRVEGRLFVSATFAMSMLAVAFLGPAAAFAIAVIAAAFEWAATRYPVMMLPANIAVTGVPNLIAGALFPASVAHTSTAFPFVLAGFAAACLAANFFALSGLFAIRDGTPYRKVAKVPVELLPALGLNIILTVALAELYIHQGIDAMAFAALVVVAFSYMAKLVVQARDRARAYAALSWGVLSGLLRTLD